MKTIVKIAIFIGALALSLTAVGGEAKPLRILPLGDSITQGGRIDRPEYSYRLRLFQLLVDANIDFQFVGSVSAGLNEEATWPDYRGEPFDPLHEGHYGWKTAKVAEFLPRWIENWRAAPDVALVHLGTNDQKSDDFQRDIVEPLREIVGLLRAQNPDIVILLGHLNFNDARALEIRSLVEALAKGVNSDRSPVTTVAHYRGWIADPEHPYADTFDWAHPNPKGQEKMALKWLEALARFRPALESALP